MNCSPSGRDARNVNHPHLDFVCLCCLLLLLSLLFLTVKPSELRGLVVMIFADSRLMGVIYTGGDKSLNECMGVLRYGFCADLAVVPEVSVLVFQPPRTDRYIDVCVWVGRGLNKL